MERAKAQVWSFLSLNYLLLLMKRQSAGDLFAGAVLAVVVLLISAGCLKGPPRSNPLDPFSEAFVDTGRVAGRVANRAAAPLAGARISLAKLDSNGATLSFNTMTGADGRFAFGSVPAGRYRFKAAKEGYSGPYLDTLTVEAGQTTPVGRIVLNALPVFTGHALHTVLLRGPDASEVALFLSAEATVADPDNQPGIAEVQLTIPAFGYEKELLRTLAAPNRFVRRLPESALPTVTLQALLGEEMRLVVRDRDGAIGRTPPLSVVRIVEETPVPVAPEGTVSDTTLTFSWEPMQLPYSFTYRLDIIRLEGGTEVLAGRVKGISSDSTSVQVTLSLASDERPKSYYWTVSAVDAHGNRARSVPMTFTVE